MQRRLPCRSVYYVRPPQNGIASYAYVVDRAGRASMVGHHPGNLSEVALVSCNGSINPVHVANRRGGM